MGQHALSVAAFDAKVDLANSRRRTWVPLGRAHAKATAGGGVSKDVMGRTWRMQMQGPWELLEKLMRGA
jgi:hypothetical protein